MDITTLGTGLKGNPCTILQGIYKKHKSTKMDRNRDQANCRDDAFHPVINFSVLDALAQHSRLGAIGKTVAVVRGERPGVVNGYRWFSMMPPISKKLLSGSASR
jgi:hypothetical protein